MADSRASVDEKMIRGVLKKGVYGTKVVSSAVSFETYGLLHAMARESGATGAAQIIRNALELYFAGYLLGRNKPTR